MLSPPVTKIETYYEFVCGKTVQKIYLEQNIYYLIQILILAVLILITYESEFWFQLLMNWF